MFSLLHSLLSHHIFYVRCARRVESAFFVSREILFVVCQFFGTFQATLLAYKYNMFLLSSSQKFDNSFVVCVKAEFSPFSTASISICQQKIPFIDC